MSTNLSSVSYQQFSLDNASSDTRKTKLRRMWERGQKWFKTPNQTPQGWVAVIVVTLSTVTFGTAYGVRHFVTESNRKICEARSEFSDANQSNFLDLYDSVGRIAGPDSQELLRGLSERMLARTPDFSKDDC